VLLARLLLGGVFLAAGLAKATLPGRRAFAGGLRGFGVPARVVPALAVLLPRVEMASAALLLAGWAVRMAALVSLGLLLTFSVGVVRVLARHTQVDCGCFGSTTSSPVGPGTVVRNAALAGLALVVAAAPSATAPWGPLQRWLPVALVAAGILAGATLVAHLDRLRGRRGSGRLEGTVR
jgi:hypothetical protein